MDAYIVGGYRSAVGKAPRGAYKFLRPDDLGEQVIRRLVSDFPQLDKTRIDDVIVGNATPEAEQGLNIGRMVSLMGLDTDKVPGMTVNRYCASGLETIAIASAKIHAGIADCIVAGGIETMSPIPFGGWRIVPNARVAKHNPEWYWGMGLTAEAVAKDFNVSREDQDAFAERSQARWAAAQERGLFGAEISPVTLPQRKGDPVIVDRDEHPRPGTGREKLAKLRGINGEDLSVTAGNASGVNDGAAAILMASEASALKQGLSAKARVIAMQSAGVAPRIMGIGPVPATQKVLAKTGLKITDMDVIELNEAFAAQALATLRALGIPDDADFVNPNGGAIAMGHPLGMSGARMVVSAVNQLERTKGRYALCTMCVGVGQGVAMIIERI